MLSGQGQDLRILFHVDRDTEHIVDALLRRIVQYLICAAVERVEVNVAVRVD